MQALTSSRHAIRAVDCVPRRPNAVKPAFKVTNTPSTANGRGLKQQQEQQRRRNNNFCARAAGAVCACALVVACACALWCEMKRRSNEAPLARAGGRGPRGRHGAAGEVVSAPAVCACVVVCAHHPPLSHSRTQQRSPRRRLPQQQQQQRPPPQSTRPPKRRFGRARSAATPSWRFLWRSARRSSTSL